MSTVEEVFQSGGAISLLRALRAGDLTAVEVLEYFIAKVEGAPCVNAVVVKDFDRARERARKLDASGVREGRLFGLPMTVKEEFDVEGLVTNRGRADGGGVATRNSLLVQHLLDEGAVIFGKTNVPVNYVDWDTYNEVYGITKNPYDPQLTPGGSSGGSAVALATMQTPLEVGMDTAGSIRVPAAFCNVLGHAPTFGLVPAKDVPDEPFGGVAGPMARSVEELELLLSVLATPPPIAKTAVRYELPRDTRTLCDMRVAVWDAPHPHTTPVVHAALQRVREAVTHCGGKLVEALPPEPFSFSHSYTTYLRLLGARGAGRPYPDVECGPLREVAVGRKATLAEWRELNATRHALRGAWDTYFTKSADIVVCPITSGGPWVSSRTAGDDAHTPGKRGLGDTLYADNFFWPHFSVLAGIPATAFRAGFTPDGHPFGLQVMGPAYRDYTTIRAAQLLMEALGTTAFTPP